MPHFGNLAFGPQSGIQHIKDKNNKSYHPHVGLQLEVMPRKNRFEFGNEINCRSLFPHWVHDVAASCSSSGWPAISELRSVSRLEGKVTSWRGATWKYGKISKIGVLTHSKMPLQRAMAWRSIRLVFLGLTEMNASHGLWKIYLFVAGFPNPKQFSFWLTTWCCAAPPEPH
jgi:hypothetical protein